MSEGGDDFWEQARGPLTAFAALMVAILVSIVACECGSRAFRAYDRWECRQWCGARGAKSWSPQGGCECRP